MTPQPADAYTTFTQGILRTTFSIVEDMLFVEGVSIATIAEQFGTPLFVYSRRILDTRLNSLRRTYPGCFRIYYSVKANPNPSIIRHFVSLDCGLEIASSGEFERAIEAGCNPAHIIYAGPGKTLTELQTVISRGLGELHIESLREAERASEIARRLGVTQAAAIRVNPAAESAAGAMRMGGKPTPFGVDEEQLDTLLDLVLQKPGLDFTGIHLFVGTQILDAVSLLAHYRKTLEIALRASQRCHRPIRTVDFGGGLGIPYFPGDEPLDLSVLQRGLVELVSPYLDRPQFGGTQFIIEPGRFLVGESGVYVARVTDIKISKGTKFVILDGGMNHHLAASGNLGQTIKRNFPMAVVNKCERAPTEAVTIVGPLCTPLDTLGRQVPVCMIEEGDLIGVFQSGAYGRTASPLGFLSHPEPKEILVDGEDCQPIDTGSTR